MRSPVVGIGRTAQEAARNFFAAVGAAQLNEEQRELVLEQLAQRTAAADLGKTPQAHYSEDVIGARVRELLGVMAAPPTERERHCFTDAYRSELHRLLLRAELAGGPPARSDNDQWVLAR
ncbi:MAG TPA: hypothetical protein VJN18_11120 [Polyangiaceae bacterium]|nr:hypothetical protein [Polyangiaceae bacterium]